MNLVLIGLRGSGKSVVGRLVASRLGRPLVDLDEITPGLLGARSVAEAWAGRGEPAFREAEARALADALRSDGRVLALGGGTPTAPGAADLLRAQRGAGRARIVYLAAGAATLRDRLAGADNAHRPSLTGGDLLAEIETVLLRRDPLYRGLADHIVPTDEGTPEQIAERIAALAGM